MKTRTLAGRLAVVQTAVTVLARLAPACQGLPFMGTAEMAVSDLPCRVSRLGYTGEAQAFMRWVMARVDELEPDGSLQIVYGIGRFGVKARWQLLQFGFDGFEHRLVQ